MSRWSRIGGTESQLGAVRSGEYAVAAGAAQRFEGGRIFYSKKTGAKELYGPILKAYQRIGGPKSALGFPRSPVLTPGPNLLARFQNGSIYVKDPAAPVVVTGAIDKRYIAAGWRSVLGWPTRSNYAVPGGERVDYAKGHIVWKRKTGSTTIVKN
jgi:uncharacterized protein with LGFP repeats